MGSIQNSLERFKGKRVLVVGDIILDKFTFGTVRRVAPEAPVPVLHFTNETCNLGGAANLARNAATLGAKVTLAGVVGDDHYKNQIFSLLGEYGIGSCILVHRHKPTTIKHRMVADNARQIARLDEEDRVSLSEQLATRLLEKIESIALSSDVVIFSDYGNGCLTAPLVRQLIDKLRRADIPSIADVKPKNKSLFHGVNVVCVNHREAYEMVGVDYKEGVDTIGQKLVDELGSIVMMRRGAEGVSVFDEDGLHTHIPAQKISISDTSGARDTFTAAAALSLTSGLSIVDSAKVANLAASIVVKKPGVAMVFAEELHSALDKVADVEEVAIVPKVWGYERWLENNEFYCCKLLILKKGYQCSKHHHKDKDEMFLVTAGHVRIEVGDKVYHMMPGNYVRLRQGTQHRFTGIEDSTIVEISTTHREEDSYRTKGEESRPVEDLMSLMNPQE